MGSSTSVVIRHEVVSLYPDWGVIKAWAKRTSPGEKIAVFAVIGSTLAVLSWGFVSLCKVMQNIPYSELGAIGFGHF